MKPKPQKAFFAAFAVFCVLCLATYSVSASWSTGDGNFRYAYLASNGASAGSNTSINETVKVRAPAYGGLDQTYWNMTVVFSVVNESAHSNSTKFNLTYSISDGTTVLWQNLTNKSFNYDGLQANLSFTTSTLVATESGVLNITLYEWDGDQNTTKLDNWTGTILIANHTITAMFRHYFPVIISLVFMVAIIGAIIKMGTKFNGG